MHNFKLPRQTIHIAPGKLCDDVAHYAPAGDAVVASTPESGGQRLLVRRQRDSGVLRAGFEGAGYEMLAVLGWDDGMGRKLPELRWRDGTTKSTETRPRHSVF